MQFRPRRQLVVTVDDGSDTCVLRFFSFYPSQQKALAVGTRLRIRGELKGGFLGWQMVHPTFKAAGGESLPHALTPVYSTVAACPQAYVRKAVAGGLSRADLSETVPADAPPAPGLDRLEPARGLALPAPADARGVAGRAGGSQPSGLAAPEVRGAAGAAAVAGRKPPRAHDDALRAPLVPRPVACTSSCWRRCRSSSRARSGGCGEEIAADLLRDRPMHRLLQGDVGSGKTVVAALAAAIAIDAGWQCALMAPTEILAEQHFRKLIGWLEPLLAPRGCAWPG